MNTKILFYLLFFFFSIIGWSSDLKDENSSSVRPSKNIISGTLFFKNEDQLSGYLTQWSKDSFSWYSLDAEKEIVFSTRNLSKIIYHSPETTLPTDENILIVLKNQMVFSGHIIKLQNDFLFVKTIFADEIKIPIQEIQLMDLNKNKKVIVNGLGNLNTWQAKHFDQTTIDPQKIIKNYANGWVIEDSVELTKNIDFPAKFQMELTYCHLYQFEFGVLNSKNLREQLTCLITPSMNRICIKHNGRQAFSYIPAGQEVFKFKFFVDAQTGKYEVYCNDVLLKIPRQVKATFDTLWFKTFEHARIDQFKISAWDGIQKPGLPGIPVDLQNVEPNDDHVFLKKNDHMSGIVHSIKDDILLFQLSYGDLSIPINEISYIRPKKSKISELKSFENIKKIYITPLFILVGEIQKIENQFLFLKTPSLGVFSIPLPLVQKITFYEDQEPAKPKTRDSRDVLEPMLLNQPVIQNHQDQQILIQADNENILIESPIIR